MFADSVAEARKTLAAIAAAAPADALDVQQEMLTPFDTLYDIMAQFFPEGARYAVDSFWSDVPDSLLGGLAESVATAASPASFAIGVVLPPDRPASPDAALSLSGRAFGAAYAIWTDPDEDDRHRAWLRATADIIAPATRGHYVGEADLDRPGRMAGCFSPAAWDRLGALRRRHDPAGLFAPDTLHSAARTSEPASA